MPYSKQKFLHRLPLTVKMVLFTVIAGLVIWVVMDRLTSRAAKNVLENQLSEVLKQQSQEDRLRFDRYLQSYHQVAELIASQKKFIDYLEKNRWFHDDEVTVLYNDKFPEWFLSPSTLRTLAIPRYALLFDEQKRVREVYHRRGQQLPDTLLSPSHILFEKSMDQTHLLTVNGLPYLVASESLTSAGGKEITLMLSSPLDETFLSLSQGDFPNRLVGLLSQNDDVVITSNIPELLPAGTLMSEISDRYVTTARFLHDYGGSEVPIRFTTFISRSTIDGMSTAFVLKGRQHRAITAFVFILSFALIMLWITKRISRVSRRVAEFSQKALGGKSAESGRGDKLRVLEERFQLLTEEVVASHEKIAKDAEARATRKSEIDQKERLFRLLRAVMDSLEIGILIRDGDELHAANRTMVNSCEMCGGSSEFEIQHGAEEERVIMDGEGNRHVFHLTSPVVAAGEVVVLARDITGQKIIEDQLRQSQKMESVGQLAGGVAHDFNNFLTAIMGYGHLLKIKLGDSSPLKVHAEQILSTSEKAAYLTQNLLAFSRKQVMNPRPVYLSDIVRNVEKLLPNLMSEDITIKSILSDNFQAVQADPGQIDQIIMNLATNARDAMPDGGALTIETGLENLNENFIKKYGYGKPGMHAFLSMTDSGIGIDEKMKDTIFEPFFTTKEVGKGTGLGLSMVYGIVKQHEGFVDIRSEPGEGTAFRIYLPVVNASVEIEKEEEQTVVRGGSETVLLAEDSQEVREFVEHVLETSGYRVITAENGRDAVERFREKKDLIQLLLFDVIMPEKNGKEASSEIRKINADIKTLFLSGYTADLIHQKGIVEEGVNLVMKPVMANTLLAKVREVLDT